MQIWAEAGVGKGHVLVLACHLLSRPSFGTAARASARLAEFLRRAAARGARSAVAEVVIIALPDPDPEARWREILDLLYAAGIAGA